MFLLPTSKGHFIFVCNQPDDQIIHLSGTIIHQIDDPFVGKPEAGFDYADSNMKHVPKTDNGQNLQPIQNMVKNRYIQPIIQNMNRGQYQQPVRSVNNRMNVQPEPVVENGQNVKPMLMLDNGLNVTPSPSLRMVNGPIVQPYAGTREVYIPRVNNWPNAQSASSNEAYVQPLPGANNWPNVKPLPMVSVDVLGHGQSDYAVNPFPGIIATLVF